MADKPKGSSGPLKELAEKFKLGFNDRGQLRALDKDGQPTETPFQFDVNDGVHEKNQKRYEQIGALMDDVVFQMMEEDHELDRIQIPKDNSNSHRSFVFASKVSWAKF